MTKWFNWTGPMIKQFSNSQLFIAMLLLSISFAFLIWFFEVPHGAATNASRLHGLKETQLFERLGIPKRTNEFTMDRVGASEFRIELFNFYPPGRPENSNTVIREYTWEYFRYRLTVWLHKPNDDWLVLDTCVDVPDAQY